MSRDQEFRDTRMMKLDSELKRVNSNHMEIMKTIENFDPKFAKHMFLRNQLIENFAKYSGGGIDILNQPMCSCERPAAWDEGGTAYCFACHRTIKDPITVREYLIEFTKGLSEEQLVVLTMQGGNESEIIK